MHVTRAHFRKLTREPPLHRRTERTKPATLMHLRAIGSGGGRKELAVVAAPTSGYATTGLVQNQFATSDVPTNVPGFLNFPAVVGAVGIFVNVPVTTGSNAVTGLPNNINLTWCTLNDIFSGRIQYWNNISYGSTLGNALNPNLVVPPNTPLSIGVRSDSSGTSQVFSGWLSGLGTPTCNAAELPTTGHPFGVISSTAYASGTNINNYFYSNAAVTVGAAPSFPSGAGVVPSNVVLNSGTQGQVTWVTNTPWSLAYIDNGQAIAAGLTEVAILNQAGVYLTSQNAVLTNSVPATLPYPDGSTFGTGASPSATAWNGAGNNGASPAAGNLYDANCTTCFPVVLFSYLIIPTSFAAPTYDAESAAMLLALLQYLYYPETTVGYNANCGYAGGVLNFAALNSTTTPPALAAYTCSSYSTPSILSGFYFAPLSSNWMTSVLTSLVTAAKTGTLTFGSVPGATYNLWTAGTLTSTTWASTGFSSGVLTTAVPVWLFEPTETSISVDTGFYTAGGAGERIISYNRMSYADFQRTQNAEAISTNAAAISTLQAGLVGTAGTILGDRTIVYRLYGSGSSLQSKLIWRAMDLLMTRAKVAVRMTYRSIGSGGGRNEFAGADNSYNPWGHFAASDGTMPTTGTPSYTGLIGAGKQFLTIPTTVAAVGVFHTVPVSALPATAGPLNMTAAIVCGIYQGTITTWDNAAIKLINPLFTPPTGQAIQVVYRGDSSGTSQIFSGWMAYTCTGVTITSGGATVSAGGVSAYVPAATNVKGAAGSVGVTTYMSPTPFQPTVTYANQWAIAYADAGFAKDAGLAEVALELKAGNTPAVYGQATVLGVAGLSAPATGYPTSSFADWTSGYSQSILFNQWQGGSSAQLFPIVAFSFVLLRKDMSAMGESGRLATALVKFMLSVDAGLPAGTTSDAPMPTSPIKFYGELLMSQPPLTIITQALSDMQQIIFSPSAPTDWQFEGYYAPSALASQAVPQYGYQSSLFTYSASSVSDPGQNDRVFSVWRSDFADYRVTSDSQNAYATQQNVNGNFILVNANLAKITANAATIATNVAALQSLQTTVTSQAASITTMQTQLTAAQALISQLQSTVASLQGNISTTSVTVSGSTTTSSTSSTTTSVATAAIVVGAAAVLLSVLLGCYVIYLKPKNVSEGNKMAVSLSPMSAPNV